MSNLHDTFGIGLSTYASYLAGNYVEEGQYTYYWALFTVNVRRAAPLHCAVEDPSAHPAPLSATISGSRVYLPTPCVLPGDDCDYRARCLWLGRLLPRTQGAPSASGLRADPSRETMIYTGKYLLSISSGVCILYA